MKPVTLDEVQEIIKNLKNSKSAGIDNINTQIIKMSLPIILPALTHVINSSISTSVFPSIWKHAKVTPLLKKSDSPLDASMYCPVSQLPVMSKVLERIMFLQMMKYFQENSFIHSNHHGARPNHSTATALVRTIK